MSNPHLLNNEATNVRIDEEIVNFMGKVWNKRLMNERTRLNVLLKCMSVNEDH